VLGLSKIFRKSIENEQKIESEVQINHVEVTQTEKIRNFEKEKVFLYLYSLSSVQQDRKFQIVILLFQTYMKSSR
jgi:hypothetical protein